MKLRCPNNPNHKKFLGKALVEQYQILDEDGKYLSDADMEFETVREAKDMEETIYCYECNLDEDVPAIEEDDDEDIDEEDE